jgi:hypothetical protein
VPVRRLATRAQLSAAAEDRLAGAWRDDVDRLREVAGAQFPGWSV